jgi:hypothetical protein
VDKDNSRMWYSPNGVQAATGIITPALDEVNVATTFGLTPLSLYSVEPVITEILEAKRQNDGTNPVWTATLPCRYIIVGSGSSPRAYYYPTLEAALFSPNVSYYKQTSSGNLAGWQQSTAFNCTYIRAVANPSPTFASTTSSIAVDHKPESHEPAKTGGESDERQAELRRIVARSERMQSMVSNMVSGIKTMLQGDIGKGLTDGAKAAMESLAVGAEAAMDNSRAIQGN